MHFQKDSQQYKICVFCITGIFILPNGQKANWKHIEALHKLQAREGLRCGNQLTSSHVNFESQIMKVSLAVQTLSASVADSIKYCREILHLPQFRDSEGTESLIRMVDRLFDLLNVSSVSGSGWKKPINMQNYGSVKNFLSQTRSTLMTMRNQQRTLMIRHLRKTSFVGFCINIDSLEQLIDDFILTRQWEYLLTYKFSQDHLELLFSCIRRAGEPDKRRVK